MHADTCSSRLIHRRKTVDPLASNKARQVALMPKQVAATVCLHRSVRNLDATHLLRALGAPVPERLENALARREHDAAGEVNLSLPEPEEEDQGAAELFELALQDEVAGEFDAACVNAVVVDGNEGVASTPCRSPVRS